MKPKINKPAIYILLILFVFSCEDKERVEKAAVSTGEVSGIMARSVKATGTIIDVGPGIIQHGHCWSINADPGIEDAKTEQGSSNKTGSFLSEINSLEAGTRYFIRSYVTTQDETVYGNVLEFTTKNGTPSIVTGEVTDITPISAKINGSITEDGGDPIISKGACWHTEENPTLDNNYVNDSSQDHSIDIQLKDLETGTKYYIRVFAVNSVKTVYGEQQSFNTLSGIPVVEISEVTDITPTSAKCGGEVMEDGGFDVLSHGLCWGTSPNPTIQQNTTNNGSGTGSFNGNLTDLEPGHTYYVRAYATNEQGTYYSSEVKTFITEDGLPILTTTDVTNITAISATTGGNITSDGGFDVIERGVCWGLSPNPTVEDGKIISGSGTGAFTVPLTGLEADKTYFIRAYARNSTGIRYGNEVQFTTKDGIPTISTSSVTDITASSAAGGGNITDDGGLSVTERGICWSTSPNPTVNDAKLAIGTGTGSFSGNITGLQPASIYYIRAYAKNSLGTEYGNNVSFATKDGIPIISTSSVTDITANSAAAGGNITDDGGLAVTERGICWSTSPNPTVNEDKLAIGTGRGSFSGQLSGLSSETDYFVRAYAINELGVHYGEEVFFSNKTFGTFTDNRDGDNYNWIRIGDQVWMAENLAYLPQVSPPASGSYTEPYYYVYGYEGTNIVDAKSNSNYETYGVLYNWPAALNACPSGWHLPSDEEWKTLEMHLGMSQNEADDTGWRGTNEGGKLKETGTAHWYSPNTGATNESGFTAVPGGYRDNGIGAFFNIGYAGDWWSATEYFTGGAWVRGMYYKYSGVNRGTSNKPYGYSVRCLRD